MSIVGSKTYFNDGGEKITIYVNTYQFNSKISLPTANNDTAI